VAETVPNMMAVALLGGVLFLTGCACCGPRYYGDTERQVGYQPMGQLQPSATYSRELERHLSRPNR
jgi:hypothetical protein